MKLLERLFDVFCSPNGSLSMMRLVVTIIVFTVLANWVYLTVHSGQKQDLSWTEVVTMLGALGVKVAQRPFESEPEKKAA